jgi:Phosphoglycerol transferase and related proteins, alkaline phosphatase superfamily
MKKTKIEVKDWFLFFVPRFVALTLVLGFLVRLALVFHPLTVVDWGFKEFLVIFGLGFLNDIAFAAIGLVPAFLFHSFLTDKKYGRPAGYILWGLLLALTAYVLFCNDITDEYGGPLPNIVNGLLIFFLACFTLKLFIPGIRKGWRTASVYLVMLLYAAFAIFIAFGEVVFWSEFGVRYNFIAVDYLVYTNEVVGNIMESYPMVPLILAVLLLAAAVVWLMVRGRKVGRSGVSSLRNWVLSLCGLALCAFCGGTWLHWGYRNLAHKNLYATQIQENGCWDFLEAFMSNELDYDQFYQLIPDEEALTLQRNLSAQDSLGLQKVVKEGTPLRKNVVLVTVESLSADFFARYGNTEGITPPPGFRAGQEPGLRPAVRNGKPYRARPGGGHALHSSERGREPDQASGLHGLPFGRRHLPGERLHHDLLLWRRQYFDNMGAFFRGCGYTIRDKKTYQADEIVYANIWGTADEDSYREAMKDFDRSWEDGQPFFAHIMTISNHRPFTYPEGRISYEPVMSREGAVKYTDWALGQFLEDASGKPWFGETVFVILADHCASSAGKTSLPVASYHIPAFVYAPGFVEPGVVDKLCSQVDLMPTVFSLLNFSYEAPFCGLDVLEEDFRERAFMATYQDLGYYADDVLTVLSPVRQVTQFSVDTVSSPWDYREEVLPEENAAVLKEAQAFYQTVNRSAGKLFGEK